MMILLQGELAPERGQAERQDGVAAMTTMAGMARWHRVAVRP
jgi:hypothetical protein